MLSAPSARDTTPALRATPRRAPHDPPPPKAVGIPVWRGPGAVGIWVCGGVFYSMAQGCSNSYVPVASVYDTPTGAYIIHEPPGVDAIQLVAVPAEVWPDGQELLAMVI